MAIYLDEDCLGSDDSLVGFPHLLLCLGVVLLTKGGLYGVHLATKSHEGPTASQFAAYLTSKGIKSQDMLALFGCGNFTARYGSSGAEAAWQKELRHIAGLIGFPAGQYAKGFDTGIIDPVDGTYVEYIRDPLKNDCKIFYKRNEKMDYGAKTASSLRVKQLGTGTLVESPASSSAAVIPTPSNKGELHEVNYALRLKKFKI